MKKIKSKARGWKSPTSNFKEKMKRNYEIKDFGKVFPGHGGVLDRFDSAFFASIVLYIALLFIQIV